MQLMKSYHFVPLAFKTMGPINAKGQIVLADLGRLLGKILGDLREATLLFQCLSVVIQLLQMLLVAREGWPLKSTQCLIKSDT